MGGEKLETIITTTTLKIIFVVKEKKNEGRCGVKEVMALSPFKVGDRTGLYVDNTDPGKKS